MVISFNSASPNSLWLSSENFHRRGAKTQRMRKGLWHSLLRKIIPRLQRILCDYWLKKNLSEASAPQRLCGENFHPGGTKFNRIPSIPILSLL